MVPGNTAATAAIAAAAGAIEESWPDDPTNSQEATARLADLRGHNRTWKDAQAGWILRELRRVGSKDPVVVLDEIDKIERIAI